VLRLILWRRKSKNEKNSERFNFMTFQSFLQAPEWQSFQETLGKKTWRIFSDDKKIETLVIEERFLANRKSFLYIPYGYIAENILEKIKKIASEQKAIFLLIEPFQNLPKDISFKLKPAIKRYQPQKTLLFDLTKTKDQLLADLNQSTRRNLKIAEKANIKFVVACNNDEKAKNNFAFLMKKTSQRDEFTAYSKEYYFALLSISQSPDFAVKLFFAEYQGRAIAANIVILYKKTAFNLHGGSDDEYRKFKAPGFLRWNQMLWAKEQGIERYDFWGIDEKKWPGVTEYKKGFGGREHIYPEGKILVFNKKWFYFYKSLRLCKKVKR